MMITGTSGTKKSGQKLQNILDNNNQNGVRTQGIGHVIWNTIKTISTKEEEHTSSSAVQLLC
eukprot:8717837-Heterocapsa_arctica.AAC.1